MSTDSSEPLGGTDSIPPQDTGAAVPPYEGRRTSADVDTDGDSAHRDGANVAGATGPVVDEERKDPEPSDTPRGAVASPADERAATGVGADEPGDPGVGPAHTTGMPRGEDQS
jgi:hypothetical protein